MTTALAAQCLPLPAKRNGALGARKGGDQRYPISRKSSDYRKTGDPQEYAATTSKCTIPFGHPPLTKTTHIAETHNITLKRCLDRPNGNWDSQEQEESEEVLFRNPPPQRKKDTFRQCAP